jgi:hypothetical protein
MSHATAVNGSRPRQVIPCAAHQPIPEPHVESAPGWRRDGLRFLFDGRLAATAADEDAADRMEALLIGRPSPAPEPPLEFDADDDDDPEPDLLAACELFGAVVDRVDAFTREPYCGMTHTALEAAMERVDRALFAAIEATGKSAVQIGRFLYTPHWAREMGNTDIYPSCCTRVDLTDVLGGSVITWWEEAKRPAK